MSDVIEIEVGQTAPALVLVNDKGEKLNIKDFRGKKNVLLYFYPKDDTPGCTVEAKTFGKDIKKYQKLDTVVIGVSPDTVESHQKFKKKYALPFDLLADGDKKLIEKYGLWVKKSMYGRKYMGVQRATFLIDKKGKVAAVWPKVKVPGHSSEVLKAISELK